MSNDNLPYGQKLTVLDKGFVCLVDIMGDDFAIVQAARVSYGEGTKSVRDDAALINYLVRHSHTTPLEMCEIKLHLKMPIFVARQWMRHRTASINEYSARYSEVKDDFYYPELENIKAQSTQNKQGSDGALPDNIKAAWGKSLMADCEHEYSIYQDALKDGISRETARIGLPLNAYTEFYWKIDLHNLLHFLRLRLDSHAQWEIRQYALAIAGIVRQWVPLAWDAFNNYKLDAVTYSGIEHEILLGLLNGDLDKPQTSILWNDLSKGEQREFLEKVGDIYEN